jgi:DGQHR domain-containing protein
VAAQAQTINVPAMRLRQFGVTLYQAILSAEDVERLVRFEVLGYGGASPRQVGRPRRGRERRGRVNWDVLERHIAQSPVAYQRPVIRRKIAELTDYYVQCAESGTLPAIPGAVLLVSNERLRFTATSVHRVLGLLQIPAHEAALRALDGQHRLLALHNMVAQGEVTDVQVPAVVFDGLSADQVVELFVTINAKHTKLNPSHLISLSGRRLYPEPALAASHDVIRALNERADSPMRGVVKLFGVGSGRVAQAPLADELKRFLGALGDMATRSQAAILREQAPRFFLAYFKQIAQAFPRAWNGRKYSIKTATALRAFLRVVPDVLEGLRREGADVLDARAIGRVLAPWSERIGDARFETDGEWKAKLAGGTRATVSALAQELRRALRS